MKEFADFTKKTCNKTGGIYVIDYGMKRYWLLAIGCWLLALLLTGCGAEQALKKGDKYYALG